MKKAFTANIFLLKSMNGVILDMAFNFCDAFVQMFYRCVIGMSIYCQKTSLKLFQKSCLLIFYHDACFYARGTKKMTLIWVSFHLVVIKPFEECF